MLAFSNDYYGIIFRATQSVELFCAYVIEASLFIDFSTYPYKKGEMLEFKYFTYIVIEESYLWFFLRVSKIKLL